jgi:tetratricopeptide (TPR) repeat protein
MSPRGVFIVACSFLCCSIISAPAQRRNSGPGSRAGEDTVSLANLTVPGKAKSQLDKAQNLLDRQKTPAARAAALKAIQIYPEYAEAHGFLGMLDLLEHKPEEALDQVEKAVQIDPNSPQCLYELGTTYVVLRRYDDALRALQTSLRSAPNLWEIHYEMSKAYLGKGDFAAALRQTDNALALAPTPYFPVHLIRAHALLGLKQYTQAVAELEVYLKRQPRGEFAPEARETLNRVKVLTAQE